MDPIKFNLFSNITGAQKIEPIEDEPPQKPPQIDAPPAIPFEETPDEEGIVDIENMNMNFDDNLRKKGLNQ